MENKGLSVVRSIIISLKIPFTKEFEMENECFMVIAGFTAMGHFTLLEGVNLSFKNQDQIDKQRATLACNANL